jgi:hypothetical protein
MPSQRTTVEDYDGSETAFSVGEEGPEAFDSVRAASPIPTVHREEQPSRLHEVFSDSSSGYATETRSDDESAFRQGPHTISYLQSEDGVLEDPAAQPIPIDPSTSTGDHTESVEGHYPEDIRPPSWVGSTAR